MYRRVGSLGDGGYLIKIPDWDNLLLISVGIGENCDFEMRSLQMAEFA